MLRVPAGAPRSGVARMVTGLRHGIPGERDPARTWRGGAHGRSPNVDRVTTKSPRHVGEPGALVRRRAFDAHGPTHDDARSAVRRHAELRGMPGSCGPLPVRPARLTPDVVPRPALRAGRRAASRMPARRTARTRSHPAFAPRGRLPRGDLPGHGASAARAAHGLEPVVEAVHEAVRAARLEAPVVVGHSVSGLLATLYAGRHPTRGVVNIDQSLLVAPFVGGSSPSPAPSAARSSKRCGPGSRPDSTRVLAETSGGRLALLPPRRRRNPVRPFRRERGADRPLARDAAGSWGGDIMSHDPRSAETLPSAGGAAWTS